jgi:TatD DNase family protein
MPEFIDSHAHLADPAFAADQDAVLARAVDAGARAVICIGESIDASVRAAELAERHAGFVWFTAGLHPHAAAVSDTPEMLGSLRERLDAGAVAIGECGLDYHYENAPRDVQRRVFAAQLSLAAERRLPVVVHTRDAEDDTRSMLVDASASGVRGVLHCFTGSRALAETAIEHGWYISFSGIITFKGWSDDDLLRLVPDDRLLAESDAPYLAPVPNRGKRNEPAWVEATVARLAAARDQGVDGVGILVSENARRLFGLASSGIA